MINIQDYLDENDSHDPLPRENNTETLDFHGEPTRQEIGKWVDRVMDISDEPKFDDYTDACSEEADDPCFRLADILISNELI